MSETPEIVVRVAQVIDPAAWRVKDANLEMGQRRAQSMVKARATIEATFIGLSPRFWTREMDHAWHRAIPDVQKAFDDLFVAALTPPRE